MPKEISVFVQALVIGTSSQKKSDAIITELVSVLNNFAISEIQTKVSAQAAMASWLVDQSIPNGFMAGEDCQLKSADESKASVKYAKHQLDITEIQEHIKGGKVPVQMGLSWEDRLSFVLNDKGAISKIDILAVEAKSKESASDFDANIAIQTGELSKLIPAVIELLGGDASIDL